MKATRLFFPVCALAALTSCTFILGESFDEVALRNPTTKDVATCAGHVGRGVASQAEIDTMSACVSWYLSQGYRKE
jgi:hypothetical protein